VGVARGLLVGADEDAASVWADHDRLWLAGLRNSGEHANVERLAVGPRGRGEPGGKKRRPGEREDEAAVRGALLAPLPS
jgi:hypothetical protein